ncbi:MAG: bifunctional phosphopantothenoylcysteine decarboxylase/phosphopantothenate--cysteine ligase CoaBC [Candidatus Nanopelagicaceae bacterium]|nr:bifunctional phosphopantothenoylcysteine decarboxylase/phosphopantothenate--cysteine ligase CoaBC [Candidatus Nanopelagicaceae bacterium]
MAGAPIIFPRGREVVLGVSAGIAAYKSCDVLRRLQDHGFLVTVIPTESSLNFVGKATWQALSGRNVATSVWENSSDVSHVSIADKADLILIAPATADLISRLAQGRADDLLTTTVLASSAPVVIVPAMHPNMWLNAATIHNVNLLRQRGMKVLEPDTGRLTGKDSGIGRFPETARIINEVLEVTNSDAKLLNTKVLVTAGGTREPIDPVRYIGNRSSGRQGLAVAYEALRSGAEVTVIAGDTDYFELEGARVIKVQTADEMRDAVLAELPANHALVMAAAVADAKPNKGSIEKIKKDKLQQIDLTLNADILAQAGMMKKTGQVIVGFAAETSEDNLELAKEKMNRKKADFLYVNNVADGAIFGSGNTSGYLLSSDGGKEGFDAVDKHVVARAIVESISTRLEKVNG